MDSTVQTDIDTTQRHAQTKFWSMETLQVNSPPSYVPSVTHPMYTIDERLEHAPVLFEENENGLYGRIGNIKQVRQNLSEPKLPVPCPNVMSKMSNNDDDQRAVVGKCSKSFEEYKEGGQNLMGAEYSSFQGHGCGTGSGLDGHASVLNDTPSNLIRPGSVSGSFCDSEEGSFYDSDSDGNDHQPITSDANCSTDGSTTSSSDADTISTDDSTGSDEDSAINTDSNSTGDFDSDGDSIGDSDSESESNGNMDDDSEDDGDTTTDSGSVSRSEGEGDDLSNNGSYGMTEDDSDSGSDNGNAPWWDQVEQERGRKRGSTRL